MVPRLEAIDTLARPLHKMNMPSAGSPSLYRTLPLSHRTVLAMPCRCCRAAPETLQNDRCCLQGQVRQFACMSRLLSERISQPLSNTVCILRLRLPVIAVTSEKAWQRDTGHTYFDRKSVRIENDNRIWLTCKHITQWHREVIVFPKPLASIFTPKTIAVIGATEKPSSVGRTLLRNLLEQPSGATIFPVNPSRSNVLGVRCYPNVAAIGEKIDLAVIITPAETVPGILQECTNVGAGGAIVISAGFGEVGAEGKAREKRVRQVLAASHLRVIGPNCLGVMNPRTGLNATFAQSGALPGNLAFLSQSGALCTAILDWSRRENVGFSGFVSVGSMLDVGWGDLIDHYGDDPYTTSILIYMESIGNARDFLSAAREVALKKPIIVIKPGRTEAARKAAASHTGAITGSDEIFEAAFRRCGILRVANIAELFDMAEVLGKQPLPKGPRLAIVTNAGGAGVLATDSLLSNGGQLAELDCATTDALNAFLPASWSHANPVDTLGDCSAENYAKAVEIVSNDTNCDAVLSILAPQAMTDPDQSARQLSKVAEGVTKPLLASWMGGDVMQVADLVMNAARIPTFEYPDAAAQAFSYMWRYTSNLQALYETPVFTGALPINGPRRVE